MRFASVCSVGSPARAARRLAPCLVAAALAAAPAAAQPPAHAPAPRPAQPPAQPADTALGPPEMSGASMEAIRVDIARRFGPPRVRVRTVGVLLYDGYTTLDAMGPYQVFGELPGADVQFVAKEKGLVRNMAGVGVTATRALRDVDSLDVLVIPGGFAGTYKAAHDTAIVNWVRRVHPTTKYTTSVCTGAWILGAAGLLRGQPATTHWWGRRVLEQEYGAHYRPVRYVHTGKVWTAAGVTAGLDMSFAVLREITGDAYTRAAMLDLEYAPEPPLRGGTEARTAPATVAWLRGIYDRGLTGIRAGETAEAGGRAEGKR